MLSPKMSSLLDAVLYEAPDQLYIFDRDGRCLYCSHKGARALGEAAQDVVGKTSQELGTRARIMEPVDRLRAEAQETGDAITHEARFSTVDGVRHYGYSLHRIDDPESGDDAVTCTVREVTEQRRTEEALQTERERLLLVADAADVIYRFRLVPDSGFEYVNAAVEEMTGYTPKQHMESPEIAGRIVHPEDHDLVRRLVENPADFAPGPTVVRWVHRDGSTIWTEQYIRPVHDGEGGLVAIEGIARDITQLRETQEQLLAEQSRFQALMNHVPDQIYFKDREHRFTRVNPAVAANARVEDAYGVLGKTDFDFVPERYADQFHAQERAIFETGDPIIGQLERYDTDDGETVWSHVTKVPTRDEAGRVDGLIGINRNVTALMQARASLTRSEARRRALFEASNVAIGMADPDGNIVEANNALHDMLGYAPEDLLGLSYKAVVHPDDRANLERLYGDAVGGKSEGTRSETRYVRKNGSTVWGDRTSAPVRDHNGHLLGVMAVIADITERKRVEEELMEEQRLFHALMSNVPDAIYFKDRDSRFVRVDEAAAHQLGAGHPDETVGKTDFDFLPDARAQSYYAEERELLTTGEPLVGVQRQTLRGDKMAGWAHVTKIPIRDSEGRIEGLLGVNRDITELMEAQEQLRDSEERVRTFAEASFEGIAISDEGRILSVNSQFAEMLGYDEAELVKMQVMDLVAQESRDLVAHERATGGHGPYEHLALRKDGTTFPVEIRARSTIWQGRRARVTAIRDITGRKKAENALRASEARFRAIYEHAPLGISVADATHRIVRANPAYHEITGRGEDELRGMPPSDYTHPDDIAESKRLFAEMMEGKRDRYRSEKRYVRPDGSITWVDRVMTAIRDVDGKLLRAFAMVEDITERRATEALLRKLSRAVEQIGDAVLIADRDGVTEYVNPAFERLTGYAREQAIGDIPPMFSTGGDEVPAGVRLRERLLAGESVSMAVRDRRKNGEFYHAHMVIAPVRGPEGDILHFALTCRDVTDQKQATEALASEANLNAAVADLSRTLLTSSGIEEITQSVLEHARRYTDSPHGFVAFIDVDSGGLQIPASTDEMWADRRMGGRESAPHQFAGLSAWALENERSFLSNTPGDDARSRGPLGGEPSVERVVVAPAVIDDALVGIVVVANAARDYVAHDLAMVERCADFYAIAVQRARNEKALRESEEKSRTMFETSALGVSLLDREGRFLETNPALREMLGYSHEELAARTILDITPEAYREVSWYGLQQLVEHERERAQITKQYRCKNGRLLWVNLTIVGVYGALGDFQYAFTMVDDITERKLQEEELREANRRLEEALQEVKDTHSRLMQQARLRALGQMASGIAHDFNNALSPIVGFAELLLTEPAMLEDTETARDYVQMMSTAARDAASIVTRMREFYRQRDEGEFLQPVSLQRVIAEAISLTQPKWKDEAQARGAPIRIHTDCEDAPAARGSESELREVLTNLIFNACDALPDGGEITISAYAEIEGGVVGHTQAKWIVLKVADTGTGMPADVRRRCLDPFFTTKGAEGTGMGLAMVYGIMQRHDGAIDVESAQGKGTTVSLRFPAPSEEHTRPEGGVDEIPSAMRVLVVDDDRMVRRITAAYLLADGHTVQTAANGMEALETLDKEEFDLVVTDRAMPEMSGDQLATTIKRRAPKTCVVMLTGFGVVMDRAPADVDGVVAKPITRDELRRAIARAMGDG